MEEILNLVSLLVVTSFLFTVSLLVLLPWKGWEKWTTTFRFGVVALPAISFSFWALERVMGGVGLIRPGDVKDLAIMALSFTAVSALGAAIIRRRRVIRWWAERIRSWRSA